MPFNGYDLNRKVRVCVAWVTTHDRVYLKLGQTSNDTFLVIRFSVPYAGNTLFLDLGQSNKCFRIKLQMAVFLKQVGIMNWDNRLPYESVHPVQNPYISVQGIIYLHFSSIFYLLWSFARTTEIRIRCYIHNQKGTCSYIDM